MKKKSRSAGSGLYRDGAKLVIRDGAQFPDRCAICNIPCEGSTREFTFERKQARYVEVAVVKAATLAAADLLTGSKYVGPVSAEVSLCAWHRHKRLRRLGIGLAMLVAGVCFLLIRRAMGVVILPPGEMGFLNISLVHFLAIATAAVGGGVALTATFDASNLWFRPTRYHGKHVWVIGAGKEFLADLPHVKECLTDPNAGDPDLSADELIRRGEGRRHG